MYTSIRLHTDVRLDCDLTLSVAGTMLARLWLEGNTNGTPFLTASQTVTNGSPVNFAVWNNTSQIWLEALEPGDASITYAFTGKNTAEGISFADSISVTAVDPCLQPVTVETAPGGTAIQNPCAVGTGKLAQYAIDVLPPGIPDSDITWSITEGANKLSFYPTGNKGRTVNVRGDAVGDFKLEVSITNLVLNPKPYIYGKVEAPTHTELNFYIVCDAAGNPPAPMETVISEINKQVTELNRVFRQPVMTFSVGSITTIKNANWFNVGNFDALTNMFASVGEVSSPQARRLKVFYVNGFTWKPESFGETVILENKGIAIRKGAPLFTLAHEVGHACGLMDITLKGIGDELVSEGWVGEKNWSGGEGTGYYPPDLKYADFIRRLLMYEHTDGAHADIPLRAFRAWISIDTVKPGIPPWALFGGSFEGMNREPRH